MDLKNFDEIIDMRAEIKLLKKRLENAKDPGLVADYAKDYTKGFERIISIVGFPLPDKAKGEKILGIIKKRLDELENKIVEAEEFINAIPESRVRTLLTLKYIEGLSWDDAAKNVYKKMTGSAARKQVMRYFEKT